MISIVEIILLCIGVIFAGLWIDSPERSFEPAIVLIFGLLAAIEAYRRHQESNSLRLITEKLMGQVERLEETIRQLIYSNSSESEPGSYNEDVVDKVESSTGMVLFDAFDPESPDGEIKIGKVGIESSTLKKIASQGRFSDITQFYFLVRQGLLLSKRIYTGLLRPFHEDPTDKNNVFVYSWKPKNDMEWNHATKKAVALPAPKNCVFVIFVQKEPKYPDLIGIVQYWAWTGEASDLAESPNNWQNRFESVQFETNRA